MLLWGILFSFVSHLYAQDFTSFLDFPAVLGIYKERGACDNRDTGSLCRHLPWAPRIHEGVVDKESSVFIFMDEELLPGTQIAKWSKKFGASSRAEMVSYFMLNNPAFSKALVRSPYTVAYLVMMRKVGESYRIVSVGMNISGQMPAEAEQYNVVQGEIDETRTEWIPPLNFKMGHQFKLNDTL
jgi:hypothetical protein